MSGFGDLQDTFSQGSYAQGAAPSEKHMAAVMDCATYANIPAAAQQQTRSAEVRTR